MTAKPSKEPPMHAEKERDVAGIAAGLTKAQREAMRAVHPARSIPFITTAACRCALQRLGLVVDRQYCELLTPLGEQVRQHLLEQNNVGR